MEKVKKALLGADGEELETDATYFKQSAGWEALSISPNRKHDPFFALNKASLSPTERRRITRLENKDKAQSKAQTPQQLSSYDVYRLVPPPYDLDQLAKLYELNPAHNAAVTTKSYNICGLGWELVENARTTLKIEQAQGNKAKIESLTNDLKKEKLDLYDIIDSLNEDEEFGEILVKTWTDVEAMGNGYLEIGRNLDGKPGYIGHIPANTMRLRSDKDGFIQIVGMKYIFFRNFGDTETENPLKNDPSPNEIIHFKKYSPHSTYYGIPDIVAAMTAVAGDALAKQYNLEYFENKAVPRYAFITKGVRLSDEAQKNLNQFFTNELKGKHHGTLYIPLPATMNQNVDAKFEPIEVRPQEQSFQNFISDSRLEVLIVHRVPPSKVGVYEHTNLAVSRDADRTFKDAVCRPEQRRIEKKINKLLSEFTETFQLKLDETDIVDADVRSRMHDRYLRTKVMRPNDVRHDLGLPSDPEGDEFLPYPPNEELVAAQAAALKKTGSITGVPSTATAGRPPGSPQSTKTSDAASNTPSGANDNGTRQQRGQALDAGARPRPSKG